MKKLALLIPVVLAAALASSPANAASAKMHAMLSGANGGDPDGEGHFNVELDSEFGDFCYQLEVTKLSGGQRGRVEDSGGKKLADLVVTGSDEDVCIALQPDDIEAIIAAPANYRVVITSSEFKDGALSGNLAKEG